MTTSKGPWIYDAESGLVLTKDRTGDWTATFPYLSTEVCSVNPLDNDIDNGHLIAAAPMLLEFIKRRADSGDTEAAQILESIDADR